MNSIPLPVHQQTGDTGVPLPAHKGDPYELVGMVVPGEPGQLEAMAQALIEEYILLGWGQKRLMTLFTNPFFQATHRIYRQKGEAWVQALLEDICGQWHIETKE